MKNFSMTLGAILLVAVAVFPFVGKAQVVTTTNWCGSYWSSLPCGYSEATYYTYYTTPVQYQQYPVYTAPAYYYYPQYQYQYAYAQTPNYAYTNNSGYVPGQYYANTSYFQPYAQANMASVAAFKPYMRYQQVPCNGYTCQQYHYLDDVNYNYSNQHYYNNWR